jgi:acetoin utilization deacetylase AcuC-like enzyme
MLVFSHADCLLHDPGVGHPESPARLRAAWDAIAALNIPMQDAPFAPETALRLAHDAGYVQQIMQLRDRIDTVRVDADTVVGMGSVDAALRAAGAGLAALDAVLSGRTKRAFCAVRPPGHHATSDTAMGFCLFNSAAIVAAKALEAGLVRVSVIDFDVHHGNGTQEIFWNEPRVQYLSSHQAPLYPYTGQLSETGQYRNIANAPLPAGSGPTQFEAVWREKLLPQLAAFAPELIVISAGFDGHAADPLAELQLSAESYAWITRALCDQARISASNRVISLLEGGYSLHALRDCVRVHLQALQDPPAASNS